jgi:poly(3-hydroxybutyrate) depolymerase
MNATRTRKHIATITILSRRAIGFGAVLGWLLVSVSAGLGQPVITKEPQNQTNTVGTTATFTVEATGTPPLVCQWQKYLTDWSDLTNGGDATLVLTNVQTSDAADYRVVVTNVDGATTSAAAHLYVIVVPPTMVLQPTDQALAVGVAAYLSARASGSLPLSYQWRLDGIDLSGATGPLLIIPHVQLTNAGGYTVLVTNLAGGVTSRIAQLSVAQGWFYTNAAGAHVPYRLFVPRNYDPAWKYPLVLFWHGAGQCGVDNSGQLSDCGQFVFLSAANQMKHPCFYLAPQMPSDGLNTCDEVFGFSDLVTNLLGFLEAGFSIDPDRVYVTGLSMGGYASWEGLARYPGLFAAGVPMSGGQMCTDIADSPGIRAPVWNFHGTSDSSVPVGESDAAVSSLRGAGRNVIYTRYQSGGHDIWRDAYSTPVLVDWVMAQKRGVASTAEPLLSITTPTEEPVYLTGAAALNLAGTAGALGQAVTRVSWTNMASGTGGIASGTKLWSVTGIPLQSGKTNLIIVTAATTTWAGYGGNTTFNDTLSVVCAPLWLSLARQGTNALLNWSGGGPPYRLQRATELAAGDWTDLLTNAVPPVTLPLARQAEFYRVVGQ